MKAIRTIAWTLTRAASEFGWERHTLRDKLGRADQQPDEKGHFTTGQICRALFGDLDTEKVKLAQEQTEAMRMKNAERRGDTIRVEAAIVVAQKAAATIRQRIIVSSMIEAEKRAILLELNGLAKTDFTEAEKIAASELGEAADAAE